MKEIQRRVLLILIRHRGEGDGIKVPQIQDELARRWGNRYTDPAVRVAIQGLRRDRRIPILSGVFGFCLPVDDREKEHWRANMRARMHGIAETLHALDDPIGGDVLGLFDEGGPDVG